METYMELLSTLHIIVRQITKAHCGQYTPAFSKADIDELTKEFRKFKTDITPLTFTTTMMSASYVTSFPSISPIQANPIKPNSLLSGSIIPISVTTGQYGGQVYYFDVTTKTYIP